MAGIEKGACWKSSLELECQAEEIKSEFDKDGHADITSIGPFMCNLFEKQLYTDVDFVSPEKNVSVSAHRMVLAAKCDFFEKLLFGDRNLSTTGMKMQVEINNIPFGVFKSVIRYFYTGIIDFTDVSTVLDICSTAQSFKIQPLIDRCEMYMGALKITEDNACSTLQVSNSKNAEGLKEKCIEYIQANTLDVISSPDFEKSSYNTVREICSLQRMNLQTEVEVLEAVMRWINVQPEHAKEELRKSLLKCVRFLSFTPKQFCEAVKRHPELVTSVEGLNIVVYLQDPTSRDIKELPSWINKHRRSFVQGLPSDHQEAVGKVKISLKPMSDQQEMTELTSVLQMRCVQGYHIINAVKFSLGDISDQGKMITILVIKVLVVPGGPNLYFSTTVDSKETLFRFYRGIHVRKGQVFHLKVEIKACQSCKFLQFDESQRDFASNHFQCSASSTPKEKRLFFIEEVKYDTKPFSEMGRDRHRSIRSIRRQKKKTQNKI